jgi:hypothetical protein
MGHDKQGLVARVHNVRAAILSRAASALQLVRGSLSTWLARWLYATRRRASAHSAELELLLWSFAVVVAAYQLPHVQVCLTPWLSDKFMTGLQTVAVTVGGAMIGATAIASSFVLFATQVNVERLPYGLFYRFSLDLKLLFAFALSFVAAIGGTALSLISKPDYASLLIVSELAAVVIVLRLLLLAYRRSLHLVKAGMRSPRPSTGASSTMAARRACPTSK